MLRPRVPRDADDNLYFEHGFARETLAVGAREVATVPALRIGAHGRARVRVQVDPPLSERVRFPCRRTDVTMSGYTVRVASRAAPRVTIAPCVSISPRDPDSETLAYIASVNTEVAIARYR